MAWERLALIQAAGQSAPVLAQLAAQLGYQYREEPPQPPSNREKWKQEPELAPETITTETEPLPAALFPRISSIQSLPSETDQRQPAFLQPGAPALNPQNQPPGTYQFAAPTPLMPFSRLAPLLFNSLAQPRSRNALDTPRLTQRIARGQSLCKLPKARQLRWPQRLQIIVDADTRLEPYWSDFAAIICYFKTLLSPEAVEAFRFIDDSSEAPFKVINWPVLDEDMPREWQMPSVDCSVLVLSDLGQGEPRAQALWQLRLNQLHHHPAPILTLSPSAASIEVTEQWRYLRPNPLNDQHPPARHPSRRGYQLSPKSPPNWPAILSGLAVLPVFDSGLLRRLRLVLNWGDSSLEQAIVNHADVYVISLGWRIRAEVAEQHRQNYPHHYPAQQAQIFWDAVNQHYQGAYQGLKQLIRLNYSILHHHDDDADMLTYFQQFSQLLNRPHSDSNWEAALQKQAQSILNSLPEQIWQQQGQTTELAYALYGVANRAALQNGQWPQNLPPGFQPEKLGWLVDTANTDSPVLWQIRQRDAQGQIVIELVSGPISGPVLYQFTASQHYPPRLTIGNDQKQQLLKASTTIKLLPDNRLTLTTRDRQMQIEAITRPSWASRLYYAQPDLQTSEPSQLLASMQWAGQIIEGIEWVPAQVDNSTSPTLSKSVTEFVSLKITHSAAWQFPKPFGWDDYGLYVDVVIEQITQRFRWIAPGEFLMGSPDDEPERSENEGPQHPVTISQGFWLADTACTQALWQAVMGNDPSHFNDDANKPVERVSWNDVQKFLQQLQNRLPGCQVDLPSEAEWEYACRAGTSTPFSFGNNITPQQVNYDGNRPYAGGETGEFRRTTVAVKSLPANPWGLYEMHGNLYEWCKDGRRTYDGQPQIDPLGPHGPDELRSIRGGSWRDFAGWARSAYRYAIHPDYASPYLGFRVCLRSIQPSPASPAGSPDSSPTG